MELLRGAACAAAVEDGLLPRTFAVAHAARFEDRLLRQLHAESKDDEAFPLSWLCMHEIGQRLFPDLPRRSLRGLAGCFGVAVPELKRADADVIAQTRLWAGTVELLAREHDVVTLPELQTFLARKAPVRGGRWSYPLAALRDRDLGLWYCARDLMEWRAAPDREHPIGPFPERDTIDGLRALALRAAGRHLGDASGLMYSLRMDPRRVSEGVLRDAIRRLVTGHGLERVERPTPIMLMQVGPKLLSDWAAERVLGRKETPDPHGLAGLEESLIHAARLRSRARLLARLSAVTVRWETPLGGSRRRGLEIRAGCVVQSWWDDPVVLPTPGAALFDRLTYRRLRVLTTEM